MEETHTGRGQGRNMEWVAQFEAQLLVCGLLAKALYGAPDRDWIDSLIRLRVFHNNPYAGGVGQTRSALSHLAAWAERHAPGLDDAAFADLCSDHTRLFIGPNHLLAPPWESVYTNKDRAVFQRETVGVKNWYLRFGLVLDTEFNEPADHIGLEFAFLSQLAERTIEAAEIRDGAAVKQLIEAQRAFVKMHVLSWVSRWADDVGTHARTGFYQGLALLAHGVALEAGSFLGVEATAPARTGPFKAEKRS